MRTQLTIVFILFTSLIFGQGNLVPNPSFEDYTNCPMDYTYFYYVDDWAPVTIYADYYNACDGYTSVPQNYGGGYQYASDGFGYAGLTATTGSNNYRLYIGCQLIDSLIINQKYFLSFKVNPYNLCSVFSNNVGMLFSNKLYSNISPFWPADSVLIKNYSHLRATTVITDTMNWITISGSFIADSSYKYLIIGNFYDDNHTDTILNTYPIYFSAYYLIDEVCVSTDSLTCNTPTEIIENEIQNKISVYPNPSTCELTIDYVLTHRSCFELYDVFGVKRKTATIDKGSNIIDLTNIDSGVYFYKIVDLKGNEIKTDKLIIEK